MKRIMGIIPAGLAMCLAIAAISPPAHGAAGDTATELQAAQRDAEARAAIAEADRAELLARLPPSSIKPLQGSLDTRQFGAAGLVKAFDLARELATEVCAALPADRRTVVYEPAAAQGVLAARQVADAISRLGDELNKQNRELQQIIDAHTPQGGAAIIAFTLLTAVPATLKSGADLSALFKTDVSAQGIAYGDGARSLSQLPWPTAAPARSRGSAPATSGNWMAGRPPPCSPACARWRRSAASWRTGSRSSRSCLRPPRATKSATSAPSHPPRARS
jgi:hypothetical protein